MATGRWTGFFRTGRILRRALREQQGCIRDVHRRLGPHLASPAGTPREYEVRLGRLPSAFLSWRRNLFSTLFHSAYLLLGIPEERRKLYGRILHLNRIWVTSADNLLDAEDKVVVPVEMPGASRVMRQVVAVMAADRVLAELLDEAVDAGLLARDPARRLLAESLRSLLPSAAQEATEEGGIARRPEPEHVLEVIHRLKTGLLFNVAFVGPEVLEPDLDAARAQELKAPLMRFGLGCQVLDDVRDLGRDWREGRHNYVLSWMAHRRPDLLESVGSAPPEAADRLYLRVPQAALPAARLGLGMMTSGLAALGASGLEYGPEQASAMAGFMFSVLDLEGLPVHA